MGQRETKGVSCPFCGAPYRKLIPPDVLQLKCDYCGASFRTPPRIGIEIPQCANHPDRFAVGICNDCGLNFCSECLDNYEFKTESGGTMLYLCPNCLRNRDVDKANGFMLSGGLVIMFGVFSAFVFLPFGIFLLIVGTIEVAYGVSKRSEASEIPTYVPRVGGKEEAVAGGGETEEVETEVLYHELLSRYIDHWGVRTGTELLDSEIKAYTWHGETFAKAVRNVYEQMQRKRQPKPQRQST